MCIFSATCYYGRINSQTRPCLKLKVYPAVVKLMRMSMLDCVMCVTVATRKTINCTPSAMLELHRTPSHNKFANAFSKPSSQNEI